MGAAFVTFGEMRGILFLVTAAAAITAAAAAVAGTGVVSAAAAAVGTADALLALLFRADDEEYDRA